MKTKKRWIRFFLFIIFILLRFPVVSQEIYYLYGMLGQGTPSIIDNLRKRVLIECKHPTIHNFNAESGIRGISPRSLSFHPDGLLYMTTTDYLIGFNVLTRQIEKKILIGALDRKAVLAVSEEGEMLISNRNENYGYLYLQYDLRKERVTDSYTPRELMGDSGPPLAVGGYLGGGDFLFFFDEKASPETFPYFPNTVAYWNAAGSRTDTMTMKSATEYTFPTPSVYRPADGSLEMFTSAYFEDPLYSYTLLRIRSEERRMTESVCADGTTSLFDGLHTDEISFPVFYKIAHETGFRQSPLRIVLDADRSSGHMTAGYYDTLTACRQAVPVADEDIELYTDGEKVDFISFRLRYYEEPRLRQEEIFSEDFPDQLERTAPSRWEWRNPYGTDTARVKEFLRSLRYRAEWDPDDPEQSRERVVMTTMHVGGDSTTSWTVYQLEQLNEIYAGRDTTALYCIDAGTVDLEEYLSPDASRDGRVEPELSAGGLIFTPKTDEAGEYFYIVEKDGCADTAVLELRVMGPEAVRLDTVFLCEGESRRIGYPPGRFDLRWWDGSRGDSILVTEADTGSKMVSVNLRGGQCGVQVFVEIISGTLTAVAGEDLEIFYCPGSPEFRLLDSLVERPGTERWIEGLSRTDGIFRPDEDEAGEYLYIVAVGSCADTAVVTMTTRPDQEMEPQEVTLCRDEERRIGMPVNMYELILWEDGTEGDSVLVGSDQKGRFGFEAWQAGCRYFGYYEIHAGDEIELPAVYPDTLWLCRGEVEYLAAEGLDSLQWDGSWYYPGDFIEVPEPGVYLLLGYRNGCSAGKEVIVEETADPSESYRIRTELCEGEETEIRLPEDTDSFRFSWRDGTSSPIRYIDLPGEYPFLIEAGDCVFESIAEAVPQKDCQPEEEAPESCTVSLPNVIVPGGENHTLQVYAACEIRILEFRVYDKWGGLRYSTSSDRVDYTVWENLPPDVYLVKVTYEQEGQGIRELTGAVTVIK